MKSPLFLVAAAATAIGGCSANAAGPAARPGQDNRPALQAAIDALSASGGGVLQLEKGVYDIAMPLYLRSGVTLAGRGRETVITNQRLNQRSSWAGVTMFAGNLNSGSFSDALGEGYPPRPVQRVSATEVMLDRCDRTEVAALPGRVAWLSTEAGEMGRRGRPNPVYSEITAVTRVDGCRIVIADPITAPPGERIRIHWSDGSRALPLKEPNVPIRDAGLRNLQLASAESTALVVTGCYRCSFTGIHFGKTRRLIGVQGIRHGRYADITGFFSERGIEFAMYATDTVVDGVDGELRDPDPTRGVKPAVRFGEYARNNTLRNVKLRLGSSYVDRDKIRFDESLGNKLENIELFVPDARDRRQFFVYRGPRDERATPGAMPPGTSLRNVRLCFTAEGGRCTAIQ